MLHPHRGIWLALGRIPESLDRNSSGTPRNAISRELFLAFNFDIFQKFPCTQKQPCGGCNFHVTFLHTAHSTPFNSLPHKHLLLPTTQKQLLSPYSLLPSTPSPGESKQKGKLTEGGNGGNFS